MMVRIDCYLLLLQYLYILLIRQQMKSFVIECIVLLTSSVCVFFF